MSQTTITPHSQKPLVTRTYPSPADLDALIARAAAAQRTWARGTTVAQRVDIGRRFMDEFKKLEDEFGMELTMQMGRPIKQTLGEMRGMLDRAAYMLSIAEKSLADIPLTDTDKPGFKRYIRREPLGVVLVVAPWNFPYLTAINSVLPALLAGNAVLLKPSPQTPQTAERLVRALHAAGVPPDVVHAVHLSPELTARAVQHPQVAFVSFTGSVPGGRAVERAAAGAEALKGVALELGGKDPAYVRPDVDVKWAAAELVDGAFFNSGQSCCAVERIYVHEKIYTPFVDAFVDVVKGYTLGDPTDANTTLGPVVSLASAERIRAQVADAVKAGAKALIDESQFSAAKVGTTYVAPQVLVDVDHSMGVMTEETFGPVVGIQKVTSDEEALRLMNDSRYGLTASVWTDADKNQESADAFAKFVEDLECGTVFLNRCDFLDPALAWTGVKDSGRGVSLSKFGFDQLTRAKSVHMKIKTA